MPGRMGGEFEDGLRVGLGIAKNMSDIYDLRLKFNAAPVAIEKEGGQRGPD